MSGFSSFGELRYQNFEIVVEFPNGKTVTHIEEHEIFANSRILYLMGEFPYLVWKIGLKRNERDIGPSIILITAKSP